MPKKEVKKTLTRAEMEEIIRGGGSIHHDGEIVTTIAGLPDDVDLAGNDDDLEAAAAALEAEEQALAEKRQKLSERFEESRNKKADAENKQVDLSSLTKAQLLEVAAERGAEASETMNKAQIIEAINAVSK